MLISQCIMASFQLVTTLMCDWWVAEMSMKDEWRSVREEVGGQCVMITGMTLMHGWCADSLEYSLVVSHIPLGIKCMYLIIATMVYRCMVALLNLQMQ